jgi:hypothetical protein
MNDRPNEKDHQVHDENAPAPTTVAEEQALTAFGEWMDAELDKLVARWIHLAAPNAQRPARISRPSLKPHAK